MKLLEFISFCTLKGLIESKDEVNAVWDHEADSHWKVIIINGKYRATIAYAVIAGTGVIMSISLYIKTDLGTEFISQPDLKLVMDRILTGE